MINLFCVVLMITNGVSELYLFKSKANPYVSLEACESEGAAFAEKLYHQFRDTPAHNATETIEVVPICTPAKNPA